MGAKSLLRIGCCALMMAFVTPLTAQAEVNVQKQNGHWHVQASNEPMSKVLSALARKANIKVSGTEKLVSDPEISGSWDGDAESVLARILREVDYATETATDKHGQTRITRVVVLSGQVGKNPKNRAVRQARKLPAHMSPAERQQAKKEGQQVTKLLESRARLAAGQPMAPKGQDTAKPSRGANSSGITRNPDGTYDIDPETQARMAEATQRAQQNLQALVNSLHRADQDQQSNSGNQDNGGN